MKRKQRPAKEATAPSLTQSLMPAARTGRELEGSSRGLQADDCSAEEILVRFKERVPDGVNGAGGPLAIAPGCQVSRQGAELLHLGSEGRRLDLDSFPGARAQLQRSVRPLYIIRILCDIAHYFKQKQRENK